MATGLLVFPLIGILHIECWFPTAVTVMGTRAVLKKGGSEAMPPLDVWPPLPLPGILK